MKEHKDWGWFIPLLVSFFLLGCLAGYMFCWLRYDSMNRSSYANEMIDDIPTDVYEELNYCGL